MNEHDGDEREYTADIKINGDTIFARSCHNTGETNKEGKTKYCVDDGSVVWHDRSDGAVVLAKKLLDTIECPDMEVEVENE